MLQDLPRDLVVPDPKGKRDLGFHLQPASAFEKRLTLLHDSKVLIFGHDGGGHVLFVSEIHEGKVGIVWEYPDDVFEMDFTPEDAPIVFWREEFLKWLQLFKTYGHDYLEEPGDEFE